MVHNGKFTLWGQSMYLLTSLLTDNVLEAYVPEVETQNLPNFSCGKHHSLKVYFRLTVTTVSE